MIRLQNFSKTLFNGPGEEVEAFLKKDAELMKAREESHRFGLNLGFVIGFITGASIAAVLILIFR